MWSISPVGAGNEMIKTATVVENWLACMTDVSLHFLILLLFTFPYYHTLKYFLIQPYCHCQGFFCCILILNLHLHHYIC